MFCIISRRQLSLGLCILAVLCVLCSFGFSGLVDAIASDRDSVALPILMYHSILQDPSRTGDYVITPTQLESDLAWLKEHGYTTVRSRDVLAWYNQGTPLPEKPVMLTFDDGHLNNRTYLLPLLEKYDMCATIFIVGQFSQQFSDHPDPNPNYAHLTWGDIAELYATGRVDIQSHTYNLHSLFSRKGAGRLTWETEEHYAKVLEEDDRLLRSLLWENCGLSPVAFAYPFGNMSAGAERILRGLGYTLFFSCEEHVTQIARGSDGLPPLGRFNRAGKYSTWEIMAKMGLH